MRLRYRASFVAAIALFILPLFSMPAFALDPSRTLTQYLHRIWQLPQGLPDATVTSILQTQDGYLLLGTETGLVRFDGVRFSEIDGGSQSALKGAWIRHILEDRQHVLWIGTNDAGVIRLEGGVASQYLQKEQPPRTTVQCLISDRNENVWACTTNGLARLGQGKVVVYGTADGLPTANVRAACETADGTLWIGGDGNQLSSWTGSSFVNHTLDLLPADTSVRALLVLQRRRGLGRYD